LYERRLNPHCRGNRPYVSLVIVQKTKGWFTIHSGIRMNYTPEMEKAMQQSHKMGYAEYERKLEYRIDVEKRREKEYEACKHLTTNIDSQIQR